MMKSHPYNLKTEKALVDPISIQQTQTLSTRKHLIELRSINQLQDNLKAVAK